MRHSWHVFRCPAHAYAFLDKNPNEEKDVLGLLNLLPDLKAEMSVRLSDFRKYQESFSLVENTWSIMMRNTVQARSTVHGVIIH